MKLREGNAFTPFCQSFCMGVYPSRHLGGGGGVSQLAPAQRGWVWTGGCVDRGLCVDRLYVDKGAGVDGVCEQGVCWHGSVCGWKWERGWTWGVDGGGCTAMHPTGIDACFHSFRAMRCDAGASCVSFQVLFSWQISMRSLRECI